MFDKTYVNVCTCGCHKAPEVGVPGNGIMMSDTVFEFMTSSETAEDKARIRKEMEEYESKGIYEYTILSKKWCYFIRYGQFTAAPIGPKQ